MMRLDIMLMATVLVALSLLAYLAGCQRDAGTPATHVECPPPLVAKWHAESNQCRAWDAHAEEWDSWRPYNFACCLTAERPVNVED